MNEKEEINNLKNENEILKKQVTDLKFNYKQLSTELGQSIFECEDLEKENRTLKKDKKELEEEITELRKEIESSIIWKIKSILK